MRISIGGQTQDAMKVLGIKAYPFTPAELSTNFRELIKVHHPDKNNGDPASEAITKKLIDAYTHLKNLAISTFVDEEQERKARTIFEEDEDLFTIWDTCPECRGLGKVKVFTSGGTDPCPDCDPTLFDFIFRVRSCGIKTLKCKYCRGTGKFKQFSGRIVECRVCKGSGTWKKVRCRTCSGSGVVFKERMDLATCSRCRGLGKIKLNPFNPVIKKGAILSTFA